MIVILDDLQERHDAFKKLHPNEQIEHCYNFAQFARFMLSYPGNVDFVSLDHDLGDEHAAVVTGNGMDAARLLAIMDQKTGPTHIQVHSWNFERAEAMAQFLRQAGYSTTIARFSNE